MSRLIFSGIILGLAVSVPATSLAQKKKADKKGAEPASKEEYAELSKVKDVVGKLTSAEESTRILSLEVEIQTPAPPDGKNPDPTKGQGAKALTQSNQAFRDSQHYTQQMARLQLEQQEALRAQNPQTRALRLQQIAARMQTLQAQHAQHLALQAAKNTPGYNAKNVKMNTLTKAFELEAQEKIVVRRQNPPYEYDDKGNAKEFTKEQLAELKGKDTTVPGYKAKYEDLQPGQQVKLYLVNPKPAKKDAKKEKDKDAPKDDDAAKKAADAGADDPPHPQVRMVMILTEPNGPALGNAADKKKKKN